MGEPLGLHQTPAGERDAHHLRAHLAAIDVKLKEGVGTKMIKKQPNSKQARSGLRFDNSSMNCEFWIAECDPAAFLR